MTVDAYYLAYPLADSYEFDLDMFGSGGYTLIDCTIAGFISTGHGKFPSAKLETQFIMSDFQSYLPTLFSKTVFVPVPKGIPQGWIDYIMDTPNLSNQYANILVGTLPEQRYTYYTNPNFNAIKKNVL